MNIILRVRRDHLFDDGFDAFRQISQINLKVKIINKINLKKIFLYLKARLRVVYIDAHGNDEMGIDQGGIFKEFVNDISKIVFDP